ncbi:rnb family domain-containing protein [Cystoisospora suis]|uniref:Rnb family domain-containing protein n=1 Tax=Cystoisospora suis TaxID=483139 RepID=A0A2C6L973_9APIC|nr:rnb family domain-containing protein [Cystoisospora suis]
MDRRMDTENNPRSVSRNTETHSLPSSSPMQSDAVHVTASRLNERRNGGRENRRVESRGQERGEMRGQGRREMRGQGRREMRGQERREMRGQGRGATRGHGRGEMGGQGRGETRGQERGGMRGQERGEMRGQERGQERGEMRGQERGGQERGEMKGQERGEARRQERGEIGENMQRSTGGGGWGERREQNHRRNEECGGEKKRRQYEEYLTLRDVEDGLRKGSLIEGVLRISKGQTDSAFVPDIANPTWTDFFIPGRKDRNRAIHDDRVVLQVYPHQEWKTTEDRDAFLLAETAAPSSSSTSGQEEGGQTSRTAEESLELVKDGRLLRTAKVVYVYLEPLSWEEKDALHAFYCREDESDKKTTNGKQMKEEEKANDKSKEDGEGREEEGGTEKKREENVDKTRTIQEPQDSQGDGEEEKGSRQRLTDHSTSSTATAPIEEEAGVEEEEEKSKSPSPVSLPSWRERKLLRNRQFICTLRGNHLNAGILPEDDTTIGPRDSILRAVPIDKRINWILIPLAEAQKWERLPGVLDKQRLYLVNADVWDCYNVLPRGSILACIGPSTAVSAIEKAVVSANDLYVNALPHGPDVLRETDEVVARVEESLEEEISRRVDLRGSRRIFTIDPTTARDLDDAIHIHRLDPSVWTGKIPEYEIGVHIADVSHMLRRSSLTDDEARRRCTTVYLPHVVFPMLPRALCDSLCSLHPGSPKLTFSVTFRVKEDGTLVHTWRPRCYKSAIESCCRFNYDQVQILIDGGNIPTEDRPHVSTSLSSSSSSTKLRSNSTEDRENECSLQENKKDAHSAEETLREKKKRITLGQCGCFVYFSTETNEHQEDDRKDKGENSDSQNRSLLFDSQEKKRAGAREDYTACKDGQKEERERIYWRRECCGRCERCCRCCSEGGTEMTMTPGGGGGLCTAEVDGRSIVSGGRGGRTQDGKGRNSCEVSWELLVKDLKLLDDLTCRIRKKRFDDGSIIMHKTALLYDLDERQRPMGWHLEEHSRSHCLIEELMLLANRLVAQKLLDSPIHDLAVLRYHPAPLPKPLRSLANFLRQRKIDVDFSTSSKAWASLQKLRRSHGSAVVVAIEVLLRKSLKLALYYVSKETTKAHYALNFSEYTHFTSPIRRYADVLVHRLLTCLVEWEGLKQSTERHDEGQSCQTVKSDAVPTGNRYKMDEKQSREGKKDKDTRQPRRKRADLSAFSTQEEDDTQGCFEEETNEEEEEEEENEKDGEAEEMSEEVKALREHVMQVCGTADELETMCSSCNGKRLTSKEAQEQCRAYFFALLLRTITITTKPHATVGVVLMIQDRSFVVFLPLLDKELRLCFFTEDSRETQLSRVPEHLQGQLTLPVSFDDVATAQVSVTWKREKVGEEGEDNEVDEVKVEVVKTFSTVPVFVVPVNTVPPDVMVTMISPFSPEYEKARACEKEALRLFLVSLCPAF